MQPSGGKKTRAGFNQSNDDLKELRTPRSTLAVPSDHSEHGQSKNLNGSLISQEWLCCHHCDYVGFFYPLYILIKLYNLIILSIFTTRNRIVMTFLTFIWKELTMRKRISQLGRRSADWIQSQQTLEKAGFLLWAQNLT